MVDNGNHPCVLGGLFSFLFGIQVCIFDSSIYIKVDISKYDHGTPWEVRYLAVSTSEYTTQNRINIGENKIKNLWSRATPGMRSHWLQSSWQFRVWFDMPLAMDWKFAEQSRMGSLKPFSVILEKERMLNGDFNLNMRINRWLTRFTLGQPSFLNILAESWHSEEISWQLDLEQTEPQDLTNADEMPVVSMETLLCRGSKARLFSNTL